MRFCIFLRKNKPKNTENPLFLYLLQEKIADKYRTPISQTRFKPSDKTFTRKKKRSPHMRQPLESPVKAIN